MGMTVIKKTTQMPTESKYVIPRRRGDYTPNVSRRWTDMHNPRKRTLIVTINGEDHIYPPKAGVIIFNNQLK